MHSCLFEGVVQHSRFVPVGHSFRYPILLYYLHLEELGELLATGMIHVGSGFSPALFRKSDHLFGDEADLSASLSSFVLQNTGKAPVGKVGLLTALRSFGYHFSPLNLFFFWEARSRRPSTIVAEVNNIPWRERRLYVLHQGNETLSKRQNENEIATRATYSHEKDFHVSPFMPMQIRYDWEFAFEAERIRVGIESFSDNAKVFQASMSLERKPLTRPNLRRAIWRYPLMSLQMVAAIYWQAFRLWRKKAPYFPHPEHHVSNDAAPLAPTSLSLQP